MSNLERLLAVLVTLTPAVAFAQPDPATPEGAPAPSPSATAPGDAGSPAVFKHGTMGLSIPISLLTIDLGALGGTTETVPTANVLYFSDPTTAFDLIVGLNLHHTEDTTTGNPPVPVAGGTIFGVAVGAGYRMYKHHSARIHTFLEPSVLVAINDFGNAADTVSLRAGAALGAEAMFTEWFSVSGTIGAGVSFTQKFKDIQLATFTSGLSANFYWE
jgi:hypothetical protein